MLFEKIANNISSKMASELKLDKDKEEIIAYGAYSLLQSTWSFLLIALFGFIFGVFLSAVVSSFAAAFLRKYSGGAHASSPNRCGIIGVIIFIAIALFIDKVILGLNIRLMYILIFMGLAYLFTYLLVYRLCPVDSHNKPIKKETKKKRLRKSSFILISIMAIVCLFSIFVYSKTQNLLYLKIAISITIGLAWQSFTLTSYGHQFTNTLDALLKNITNAKVGGEKQ